MAKCGVYDKSVVLLCGIRAEKDDVWHERQIKVDCEARLWSELTALGRLCADLPTGALCDFWIVLRRVS